MTKLRQTLIGLLVKLFGIKFAKKIDTYYRFNRVLHFHNPKLLIDKIAYLEYFEPQELKALCSDKFRVRSYVSSKGLEEILIPVPVGGGPVKKFSDLNFDRLPNSFIIKATHGSGMNIFVPDKTKLNMESCKLLIEKWLETTYGLASLESHYWSIPHRVYVENYIGTNNQFPIDYKIHCLNGKPQFIQVVVGRNAKPNTNTEMYLFDTQWNFLEGAVKGYRHTLPGRGFVQKPQALSKMLDIATILASDFKYVRVDLYVVANKVFFGELTFTPSSCAMPYLTDKFLDYMGSKLSIK